MRILRDPHDAVQVGQYTCVTFVNRPVWSLLNFAISPTRSTGAPSYVDAQLVDQRDVYEAMMPSTFPIYIPVRGSINNEQMQILTKRLKMGTKRSKSLVTLMHGAVLTVLSPASNLSPWSRYYMARSRPMDGRNKATDLQNVRGSSGRLFSPEGV